MITKFHPIFEFLLFTFEFHSIHPIQPIQPIQPI